MSHPPVADEGGDGGGSVDWKDGGVDWKGDGGGVGCWVDDVRFVPVKNDSSSSADDRDDDDFDVISFNVLASSYVSRKSHPKLPPGHAAVTFDHEDRLRLLIETLRRLCCCNDDDDDDENGAAGQEEKEDEQEERGATSAEAAAATAKEEEEEEEKRRSTAEEKDGIDKKKDGRSTEERQRRKYDDDAKGRRLPPHRRRRSLPRAYRRRDSKCGIVCLQEVDQLNDLLPQLIEWGYGFVRTPTATATATTTASSINGNTSSDDSSSSIDGNNNDSNDGTNHAAASTATAADGASAAGSAGTGRTKGRHIVNHRGGKSNNNNSHSNSSSGNKSAGAGGRVDSCIVAYDKTIFALIESDIVQFDDLATLRGENEDDDNDNDDGCDKEEDDDGSGGVVAQEKDRSPSPQQKQPPSTRPSTRPSSLSGLTRSYVRRNAAVVAALRHIPTNTTLIVSNAHLYWHPGYEYVKLCQAKHWLDAVEAMSMKHGRDNSGDVVGGCGAPVILCGDLNSKPGSAVHAFVSNGTVDARDVAPWYHRHRRHDDDDADGEGECDETDKGEGDDEGDDDDSYDGNDETADENDPNRLCGTVPDPHELDDAIVAVDVASSSSSSSSSSATEAAAAATGGSSSSDAASTSAALTHAKGEIDAVGRTLITKLDLNEEEPSSAVRQKKNGIANGGNDATDNPAAASALYCLPTSDGASAPPPPPLLPPPLPRSTALPVAKIASDAHGGPPVTVVAQDYSSSGPTTTNPPRHPTRSSSQSSKRRRSPRNPTVRYLLDNTLNRFTRWLRILGIDAALETGAEERLRTKKGRMILFERCVSEKRTLLTTSYKLLLRKDCPPGAYLLDPKTPSQLERSLVGLLLTHGIVLQPSKFLTRCVVCNGRILDVFDEAEKRRIFAEHQAPDLSSDLSVYACDGCGQGYWWCDRPTSSASRVKAQATHLFRLCLRGGVPIDGGLNMFGFVDCKAERRKGVEERRMGRRIGRCSAEWDLRVVQWLKDACLSHPFNLRSAYALFGREDDRHLVIGESLPFTNVTADFVGTLDYIFFEQSCLRQTGRLAVPTTFREMNPSGIRNGFLLPSDVWPSDHLAIGSRLRIMDDTRQRDGKMHLNGVQGSDTQAIVPPSASNKPGSIKSPNSVKKMDTVPLLRSSTTKHGGTTPISLPTPHGQRCVCGCVPQILSLFEMAELRKKAREEAKLKAQEKRN